MEKFIFTFIFVLILISSAFVPHPAESKSSMVNILEIAGRSKSDVSRVLGEPLSCKVNKYGEKCTYNNDQFEIIFANDLSNWITIHPQEKTLFGQNVISLIGLKEVKPTYQNGNVLIWDRIQGLLEVSAFSDGEYLDYIYVKKSKK